jgi:hypothetical protein
MRVRENIWRQKNRSSYIAAGNDCYGLKKAPDSISPLLFIAFIINITVKLLNATA